MEAKKARSDAILYGVLTAIGIVFYKWIIPTQIYMSKAAVAEAFSPDTFPNAATALFTLASFVGFVYAIYRYQKAVKVEGKPQKNKEPMTKREFVGIFIPFIVFALVVLYAVLFHVIGFIPATAIVPPVILFVIGCRKRSYYVIYYIFAAAMFCLFRYILMVPIR